MNPLPAKLQTFLERKDTPLYIHLAVKTDAYPLGCRGYSIRTEPDNGSAWITILTSQWLRLREHVHLKHHMAVLVTSGVDNESYQLKGGFIDCRSMGRQDAVLLEEQQKNAALLYPNLLPLIQVNTSNCVKVGLQIACAYDQTPGPSAGDLLQ